MAEDTRWFAIVGVVCCTLFTAAGQIFYKIGSQDLVFSFAIVQNWQLFLGLLLYGIGLVLLTTSFQFGELSVLFPFVSLSFVWVSFAAILVLGETMSMWNWMGVGSIVVGVVFIGMGKDA